jgi:hypothetical protein
VSELSFVFPFCRKGNFKDVYLSSPKKEKSGKKKPTVSGEFVLMIVSYSILVYIVYLGHGCPID